MITTLENNKTDNLSIYYSENKIINSSYSTRIERAVDRSGGLHIVHLSFNAKRARCGTKTLDLSGSFAKLNKLHKTTLDEVHTKEGKIFGRAVKFGFEEICYLKFSIFTNNI